MNYVFISPNFPRGFANFAIRLREAGVTVLGVGQDPWEELGPELWGALTEYYRVANLDDYDVMCRAMGHLIHRHGRIHRLESHNEHWLMQDARLRTDFNIPGLKLDDMGPVKYKSLMKEVFRACQIPVARGKVVTTEREALSAARELGYPVVIKPDMGVGAQDTMKLNDDAGVSEFMRSHAGKRLIMEEFIEGSIVSFDGLTDGAGNIIFSSSFEYSTGVMDIVNSALDVYYHTVPEIPADLAEAGRRAVKGFGLKERFFHLEFFRRPGGDLVALEANMRPPGGYSLDLWNYAADLDIYQLYARMITGGELPVPQPSPYIACYLSRRDGSVYCHSLADAVAGCGKDLRLQARMPAILAKAMGDEAFILRVASHRELEDRIHLILDK